MGAFQAEYELLHKKEQLQNNPIKQTGKLQQHKLKQKKIHYLLHLLVNVIF